MAKVGLKANGTLKKGYRWGKGGKIIKAKATTKTKTPKRKSSAKPKTKKRTTTKRRRPSSPQIKGQLSKTVVTQHFEPN